MSLITGLLAELLPWIVGALGIAAALFVKGRKDKRIGRLEAENEQIKRAAARTQAASAARAGVTDANVAELLSDPSQRRR